MKEIKPLPCPKCHQTNVLLEISNVPEWETEYKGEHFYFGFHQDIDVKCGTCGWRPSNFGYKPWGSDTNKLIEWWNLEVRKTPLY